MNRDFNDFLNTSKKAPLEMDNQVLNYINSELNPSHKLIFYKLVLIHGFIGLLTMLFCPQFSLSLTNNYQLFHYFHHTFGEAVCSIICGAIFLGSGTIFAAALLNPLQIKKIKDSQLLYYVSLSIITVSIFTVLGMDLYLKLVFFWILGAVGASMIILNLSSRLRGIDLRL